MEYKKAHLKETIEKSAGRSLNNKEYKHILGAGQLSDLKPSHKSKALAKKSGKKEHAYNKYAEGGKVNFSEYLKKKRK